MSAPKKMVLRVQSSEGTARVEVSEEEVTAQLYERVYAALSLSSFGFALHKDRQRREEIVSSKTRRVRDYSLQHGDMLYMSPVNGAVLFDHPSTSADIEAKPSTSVVVEASTSKSSIADTLSQGGAPQEDDVDLELYKESGSIQRQRDEKLCRHNSNTCCVHCSPLEPWDENYLKEHNIKHMSFHAYLRKIQSKNFISLNELSYKIKPGCTEHPPWPRGICSACQPGAVTLARQPWRHVDNVVVEHPAMVDRFLSYWRATGQQRAGLLYGRVERHPSLPLGVRARVAAIYEPPQVGDRDSIRLLPDPRADLVDHLAERLGLRPVGWIFTDLLPLDAAAGTVQCTRGADTYFLSAQECIMAAHFQNLHPNACRHSATGYYGSKFVTVCVTGDSNNAVHMEGYQVSNQAAALVRDGVLLPTRDAPELAAVRAAGGGRYVPDVFYRRRDRFGNDVRERARAAPVAYLLVDVPAGAAGPALRPALWPGAAFPPAHRAREPQALAALAAHARAAGSWLRAASDLHALLFLATNDALPLAPAALEPLLAAVREQDAARADAWRAGPDAATLLHLAAAAGPAPADWTCRLCTFRNAAPRDACEMCAMPR